jgi:zinc/manganese transport system permease protein
MLDFLQLDFMVQAFIVSIIIGVVLAYLGVHVVGRGIVFVDLALGQISSLGVAYSDYVGYGHTTIPIAFALTGAFLMSMIHISDKRLKLEAVIGIVYALSSAVTVMLISKSPHGDSDIQEVLFGNILSINAEAIKTTGIIFGALALLHIIFHKKFIKASEIRQNVEVQPLRKKIFNIWNFIFYLSIGLAIVFSVRISGVIPVFSFLIIPAVGGIMLSKKNSVVIISAIMISILGVFFGLHLSYHYDFPAGSSLVATLGMIFFLVAIWYFLKNKVVNTQIEK